MIWDLHTHLTGVSGTTPTERMAELVRYADRMGVDRLIVFMGLRFSHDPDPDDFRRQNDEVLEALQHFHDRAFGFAYLNPRYPEASLDELDRCIRDGPLVGVKLWVARRAADESLDPIIRRATERKALVFQHTWDKTTGNLPGESTPSDLAALARRHPRTSFICGHAGGNWQLGIRAVRDCPNVAVGLGGFDPAAGSVEMAVRTLGADRVIYGSDAGGRSFASQLGKVFGANISNHDRQLILGKNLRRLLAPILEAKGVAL